MVKRKEFYILVVRIHQTGPVIKGYVHNKPVQGNGFDM